MKYEVWAVEIRFPNVEGGPTNWKLWRLADTKRTAERSRDRVLRTYCHDVRAEVRLVPFARRPAMKARLSVKVPA